MKLFIASILIMISLISCDLFDKKVEKKTSLFCEADPEAFSYYFTKEITAELDCLQENLNRFVEGVKTDKVGYLSYRELRPFIIDNFPEFDHKLLDPIEGVFIFNSLLTGDDPLYIRADNVEHIMELFKKINKIVVEKSIYSFFVNKDRKDYLTHNTRKAQIYQGLVQITELLLEAYVSNSNEINLSGFLRRFTALDKSNIIENSEKLSFVKKLFLGGSPDILSSGDFKRFIGLLPDILKSGFDLYQFEYIQKNISEEEDILQSLVANTKTIINSLYYGSDSEEELFTLNDLLKAAQVFYDDVRQYKKYSSEMLKIKEIFLGSSSPYFTAREIYNFFDNIVLRLLKKGESFYRIYRQSESVLNSGSPVLLERPSQDGHDQASFEDVKSFNRIVKNYSYFKGTMPAIISTKEIKRTPYSVFEVAALEDILFMVFRKYATVKSSELTGGLGMTQSDLEALAGEFKVFLIDKGFVFKNEVTGMDRMESIIETVTLLGSLFQHQSSGDAVLSLEELTELVLTILSSMNLADMLDQNLRKICEDVGCQLDYKKRYSVDFYRRYLTKAMEMPSELGKVETFLPGLHGYLKKQPDYSFLETAEAFSRSCTHFDDGAPVPMERGDLFSLLVGMQSIEHTINRFDTGGASPGTAPDGILQPDEVRSAFPIYKRAIEVILDNPALNRFSEDVFLYLIKYETVPDTEGRGLRGVWNKVKGAWKLLRFSIRKRRGQEAIATRSTLAKVLDVISQYSPQAKENPFPCESLR